MGRVEIALQARNRDLQVSIAASSFNANADVNGYRPGPCAPVGGNLIAIFDL